MKSLSSVVVLGGLGEVFSLLKSDENLLRVLCSGVLNRLGRLLRGLSVVGLVKGLSLLVDFLVVTFSVCSVGVVVSSSVVSVVTVVTVELVVVGVVAELRLMVLSLLTPSMLDKVTSINLSTETPPDTSVDLLVLVVSVLDLEILSVQSADCQLYQYLTSSPALMEWSPPQS